VYIAGPEVFLPVAEAEAVGAAKKAACARFGLDGLWPPDCGADLDDPHALFAGLVAMMDRADAAIACCTPWRGSGMDPGTAFEVGYLHAQAKPVLGYTNDPRDLADRVDPDGFVIEAFGFADNLMVVGPSLVSGHDLVRIDAAPEARWTDLRGFESCAEVLAARAARR
jgi:nucleoside 2-deoxyribosyltransferase